MNYLDLLQRQRVFNAPMCGITDHPFRELCRRMGAEVTYNQMASSEGMIRSDRQTINLLDLDPGEPRTVIQLFGGEPQALADSARKLQDLGAAVVDLNMGCPVRKVVAGQAGSALLKDLPRVERIFKLMRAAVTVPFTVKMRWDWDHAPGTVGSAALMAARMAEAEGLDSICLHARTRAQGYAGSAQWDQIATLKAAVKIPVIGNGDIREPVDALEMMRQTGCDAVMIGRALIGDPWLMRETIDAIARGSAARGRKAPGWEERRRMMLLHAELLVARRGPKGLTMFRKHAVAYLRGLRGVRQMRNKIMHAATMAQLEEILEEGPDPNDPTMLVVHTDEHEARLRPREGADPGACGCDEAGDAAEA